jgi:hypothetical protein
MGTDLIRITTGASLTSTEIEHSDCSKAHRTLDLHPAPTGCQLTQATELGLKSDRFAAGWAKAPLTKCKARTACWMMWLPSMTYCLPCSHMTKTQLHHIQKKMTSVSLSKRGCRSKISRAVIFGPRRFLGIGDRHLCYEQGIGGTLQLLKHIRSDSKLGTFLKISLDWTQLHAGVSFPILQKIRLSLLPLEQGWFPATRTFLGSINANMQIPNRVLPSLLRVNDCILMDNVLQHDFSPSSIRMINLCWLFLQVESLAEICNTTGNSILVSVWKGQRPASKSRSLWPRQARPHEPSWQFWRRFVRLVHLHPWRRTANARSTDLRLDHNLGPWIGSRHLVARRWPTYLSTDGERLFHCHNDILRCSSRIASHTRHANKFPRLSNPAPSLPTDAIPVAVQLTPAIAIVHPTPFPLFLELCLRFFDVLLSDSISPLFCCDNLGLIKRVNHAMNRSWDNPNHCLSSEYDVESGIVDILNRLPLKLTCLHVKGHQDGDAPVAELPWEAQMNCHADACATNCLNNWSAPSLLRKHPSLLLVSL